MPGRQTRGNRRNVNKKKRMRHESMAHPLFRFFNRPTDITDNADLGF